MQLNTPIAALKTVGKAMETKLKRLGIEKAQDLLFYYPFRYEDYSNTKPISQLETGEQVTVKVVIELIASKRSFKSRRNMTEAVVSDDTGQLRVIWWGQPYIAQTLKSGDEIFLSGKITEDMYGPSMKSPAYEKVKAGTGTHTGRIVPMYPLTSGITQKQMRYFVSQVIELSKELEDWIPEDIQEKVDIMPYEEALHGVHFPEDQNHLEHSQKRMKFDELFVLQLRAEMLRQSLKQSVAPAIELKEDEIKSFVSALPFELTAAQKKSSWAILKDIERPHPMNRLLEGDVGSGKTIVAAMTMHNVVLNRLQSAIMAPTEILAKQHFESLEKTLDATHVIGLLTGNESQITNYKFENTSKAGKKREFLQLLKEGKIDIAVGTHALISDSVEFGNLGLVIVDEQHRFGVKQRKKIKELSGDNSTMPHFLSMTATPIPRSFALTLYGDLDLSIIDEMPTGRKPVKTRLVEPSNRSKAYDFIHKQVVRGRQVFVICPMIDSTKGAEKKTVMQEYQKLSENIFPEMSISYLHGRMKVADKDAVMKGFAAGEIDILVSTSVVEVGVNIPNASVMMIEGAERFGLAQLHQFRGRVGRAEHQSYCFLFSDSESDSVHERLTFFENNTDGFKVAEYDLEIRGPGEVYGTNQSGMMQLQFATLQDAALIQTARDLAKGLDFEAYPTLRNKVKKWEESVHLE
jgi:ATP-dependent DNA helicase RecG